MSGSLIIEKENADKKAGLKALKDGIEEMRSEALELSKENSESECFFDSADETTLFLENKRRRYQSSSARFVTWNWNLRVSRLLIPRNTA